MCWMHITEWLNFRIGDQVFWLEQSLKGEITEMVCSPEGPVFWLSCAPYWVKPSEVVPASTGATSVGAQGFRASSRCAWPNIYPVQPHLP